MTVYYFAGPSMPPSVPDDAGERVVFMSPIKHGDLLNLDVGTGDVVAIVDGMFYREPAVRHKEILDVMSRGATVIGGASMGALRAAELQAVGVIGIGRVFELFSSGQLDGDDEVAVMHGDAESGYRPLSVALVCLREAGDELVALGVLGDGERRALVDEIAGRFFGDRTLAAIRRAGRGLGVPEEALGELMRRLDGSCPDVKVRDARLVLEAAIASSATPPGCSSRWETDNVARWRNVFVTEATGGVLASDRLVFRALQLIGVSFPELYAAVVCERLSSAWGLDGSPSLIAREFSRRSGIRALDDGIAAAWLYPPPRGTDSEALLRLAVATYREAPGLPPWGALVSRLAAAREPLAAARGACEAAIRRNAELAVTQPPERRPELASMATTLRWVAELWSVPADPDIVRRVAYTRAFRDVADVHEVARKLIVLRDDERALDLIRHAPLERLAKGITL